MLQCFFIEMRADDDDLTGELRRALTYLGLTRYEVEVHPVTTVLGILEHTLAADDGAVGLTLGHLVKDGLKLRLAERMRRLHTPVSEDFVRVMVMTAAVTVLIVLVMMVLMLLMIMVILVVIMVAAVLILVVIMVTAVLILIMLMLVIMIVVVMMFMIMCFLGYFCE